MVTFLIIILSIYLLGKLLKWLLPIYIMRKARQFNQQTFSGQSQPNQKSHKRSKEGDVTVEVKSETPQKINKDLGDYVEYVEEEKPE